MIWRFTPDWLFCSRTAERSNIENAIFGSNLRQLQQFFTASVGSSLRWLRGQSDSSRQSFRKDDKRSFACFFSSLQERPRRRFLSLPLTESGGRHFKQSSNVPVPWPRTASKADRQNQLHRMPFLPNADAQPRGVWPRRLYRRRRREFLTEVCFRTRA